MKPELESTNMKQACDRCDCGRLMTLILGIDSYSPEGVCVYWCAGCGVVNVHRNAAWEKAQDEWYRPRTELVGVTD